MPSGPGKYEGEGAETYILDAWMGVSGYDDMVASTADTYGAARFDGPFSDADIEEETLKEAAEYGYTPDEIEAAQAALRASCGAILTWDTYGFVHAHVYGPADTLTLLADWADYAEDYSDDDEEEEE